MQLVLELNQQKKQDYNNQFSNSNRLIKRVMWDGKNFKIDYLSTIKGKDETIYSRLTPVNDSRIHQ